MTTPVLPDYAAPFKPVPNVTPFTIRDGATMLKKIDYINKYIDRVLIPWINENFAELADEFETQVNALLLQVNAALQEQTGNVDQAITDLTAYVDAAVQEVITAGITVSDPVMTGVVQNEDADFTQYIKSLFNTRAVANLSDYLPESFDNDGSVACDTYFNLMLNSGLQRAYVPNGIWKLDTAITIPNDVREIELHPNAVVTSTVTATNAFTKIGSGEETTRTISAEVLAGSKSFNLANTVGLAVGDGLFLTSTDNIPNASSKVGFIRKIVNISGSLVTVDTPIFRNLTTSPKAIKLNFAKKLHLKGGTWKHSSPFDTVKSLWQFTIAEGPDTTDVTIGANGGPGIQMDHCIGGVAINTNFVDLVDDSANGHYGYGFNWGGATRDHVWLSGIAKSVRHAVTTNATPVAVGLEAAGTLRGEPDSCKTGSETVVMTGINAAYDTHEAGYNITIRGTAMNVNIGAQTRSSKTDIDITVVGASLFGAYAHDFSSDTIIKVNMLNNSLTPTAGANAIRIAGTGASVKGSTQKNAPAGWGAINATQEYVIEGGNNLEGTRIGIGKIASPDGTFKSLIFGANFKRLLANFTANNTTAYATVPDISFVVPAGSYAVEMFLIYSSAEDADLKLQLVGPSGGTVYLTALGLVNTATGGVGNLDVSVAEGAGSAAINVGGAGVGTKRVARITGVINSATVAATARLNAAQTVAQATDTVIYAGSWFRITPLD